MNIDRIAIETETVQEQIKRKLDLVNSEAHTKQRTSGQSGGTIKPPDPNKHFKD